MGISIYAGGEVEYICGYKRPLDLLSSFLFLRYGIDYGIDKNEYTVLFNDYVSSLDNVKEMGKPLIEKQSGSDIYDYKVSFSKLFYNVGRMTLLNLFQEYYYKLYDEDVQSDSTIDDVVGLTKGMVVGFSEEAYSRLFTITKDFSKNGIVEAISPVKHISKYFEDDIKSLNHANIIPVVNTAVFYSILGSIMGNIENDQFKELFKYGETLGNVNGSEVMAYLVTKCKVEPDKMYNIGQFCMIFNLMTEYIEKSIGKEFDDRFTKVFKAIGDEFRKQYDKRTEIKENDYRDLILSKDTFIHERMMILVREILRPTSPVYVGDHTYDLREMFLMEIYDNKTSYTPPLVKILEEDVNLNFSNLDNYTSVIDVHAYERAIKAALIQYKTVRETRNDSDYIKAWYNLRYLEKLLYEVFKYWNESKTPLKIEGVDEVFVEVDKLGGNLETRRELHNINDIEYSKAYEITMKIIRSLNARYCEAQDYIYTGKRGIFNRDYYMRLSQLSIGQIPFDSLLDAARYNQYGKYPYFVTLGSYDNKEIKKEALKSDLNTTKLHKLDILDTKYDNINNSVSRTPYEVIKSGSFNERAIDGEGGKELAGKVSDVIRGLTNHEFLYLSR